jgi:hypothetical protein
MGGVIAGLHLLGQSSRARAPDSAAPSAPTSGAPTAEQSPLPKSTFGARSLLPARSWLVVDFDGRLTGTLPFSSQQGCSQVPAPARVALSVVGPSAEHTTPSALPSTGTGSEPRDGVALLLGSPDVSAEFWRCVKGEVLAAGGRVLDTSQGQETLESPSGVLSHSQGRLLFASDRGLEAEVIRLARGQGDSAASAPPHASLAAGISSRPGSRGTDDAPLLATLELPPAWLSGVGPEAQQSPLRHLIAGALRAETDGGASGTLECHEPGCDELAAFLLRARTDLAAALPAPLGAATERSWVASRESPTRASHPSPAAGGRGLVRLRWIPRDVAFGDWVSGVWRIVLGDGAAGETGGPGAARPAKP